MIEIDAVDTALIDADLLTVRAALLEEFSGRTHWWLPHLQITPRNSLPPDQVGAMFDIAVHGQFPSKFTTKVTAVTETRVTTAYVGGDFRGEGIWIFEPEDGKTRITFRWHVSPVGWTAFLLSLNPKAARAAAPHHQAMRAGFAALNAHLGARKPVTA